MVKPSPKRAGATTHKSPDRALDRAAHATVEQWLFALGTGTISNANDTAAINDSGSGAYWGTK
jgi:hypothetical protein